MFWERIVKEICRQTCDNFNEAIRDGNDELCDFVVGLDAIDTKYRIVQEIQELSRNLGNMQ